MYRLCRPAGDLTDVIESYWAVTAEDGPVDLSVDVFVDGRPDLVFNFGAPWGRQVIGGGTTHHDGATLDAQRMVPIRIVQRGQVRIFGVRFRLGGFGPFVGSPLRPLTGGTWDPAVVWGQDAAGLTAAIRACAGLDAAGELLDGFFRARRRDEGRAPFVRALAALEAGEGRATVGEAAAAAGTSGRQVERLFAHHVGLPPKTVGRVLRFQGALRALMRDPGCGLADVALQAGYFDQAHFIRDFRAMTGGVPRGYRGYYPPDAPTDFAPNVVVFVQAGDRRRP